MNEDQCNLWKNAMQMLIDRMKGDPTTELSFGEALVAMNIGLKVCRAGWNGKGMWIVRGEGNSALPAEGFWNKHTRAFAEEHGGTAEVLPYILFKTADDKILMGWLASQSDIFATDWQILAD